MRQMLLVKISDTKTTILFKKIDDLLKMRDEIEVCQFLLRARQTQHIICNQRKNPIVWANRLMWVNFKAVSWLFPGKTFVQAQFFNKYMLECLV